MRLTPFLIALLVIALWLSNPEMDEFRPFFEARTEQVLEEKAGDTALGRALSSAAGSLAGSMVDRFTERTSYVVASVYTVDLDGDASTTDDRWKYLGIADTFFTLERPSEEAS